MRAGRALGRTLLFALLCAAGCEAPPAPPGAPFGASCSVGGDCESGLCVRTGDNGACTRACASDCECPPTHACVEASPGLRVCAPGASTCETDPDAGLPADAHVDVPVDGGPIPSMDACVPESSAALCTAAGLQCGTHDLRDRCGATRTASCGGCVSSATCIEGTCVARAECVESAVDTCFEALCGTEFYDLRSCVVSRCYSAFGTDPACVRRECDEELTDYSDCMTGCPELAGCGTPCESMCARLVDEGCGTVSTVASCETACEALWLEEPAPLRTTCGIVFDCSLVGACTAVPNNHCPDEVECAPGVCAPGGWCDGSADCPDAADERAPGCTSPTCTAANTRLCAGACATCPTEGVASLRCDATACVPDECAPSFHVCATGCCPTPFDAVAFQFGTDGPDVGFGIDVDASGRIAVVGLVIGALPGQTNGGAMDAFVRVYDASFTELWTRQSGGSHNDEMRGVAIDASGNVLVAGSAGGIYPDHDVLVRAYDAAGTELWSRQFGSSDRDFAHDVDAAAGLVAVAGIIGAGALPGQIGAGGADAFVRVYDPSGTELWTRQFGVAADDFARAVRVDLAGRVLVAGRLGSGAFVRVYDSAGTELWTREFAAESVFGIDVDAMGRIVVVGAVRVAMPGQTHVGLGDAFVRVYDGTGTEVWTRQFGTTVNDTALAVSVDASGSFFVGGDTQAGLPGHFSVGGSDAFVRAYDAAGTELWTNQFGTPEWDELNGIQVDGSGRPLAVGRTGGTLPGETSAGMDDVFVARVTAP